MFEALAFVHSTVCVFFLRADDMQNLVCSRPVQLVVIVELKDINQERLRLHRIKLAAFVIVMLLEYNIDILGAIKTAGVASLVQSLLVLVENVGSQQVRKEVKACEHEEHEQEGVPETDTLRGQEDVWVVSSSEKNCHVAVGVADGAKICDTLKGWTVEVVDCEDEYEDVSEHGDEDCHGVP